MPEDAMVGWHHRLDGHKLEQVLGVGDGQGSLACCSPRDWEESAITERLNSQLNGKDSACTLKRQTKRAENILEKKSRCSIRRHHRICHAY